MAKLNTLTFAQKHSVVFICFFSVVLVYLGFYDQVLSRYLITIANESFVTFQSQSLFEDGKFGGSDLGTIFQLACLSYVVFFLVRRSLRSPFQVYLARYSSFVVFSSIYYAIVFVQGTKFAVGRTRPYLVLGNSGAPQLYSEWYELGLHSIASGKYPGSFPSGHTASAAAFFALLFFSWSGSWSVFKRQLFAVAVFAFSFSQWVLMGIARVMGRDHWPSDCAAAGLFVFSSFAYFAHKMKLNTQTDALVFAQMPDSIACSEQAPPVPGLKLLFPAGFLRSYLCTLGVSLLIVLLYWGTRETILP